MKSLNNNKELELCQCEQCNHEFDIDSSSVRNAYAVVCPGCNHVSTIKNALKHK